MPDYIFMLESRLAPEQLRALNRVVEEAQASELNVYLVGGAVRDLMTGSPIRDLDFTLEGNPLRVAQRLARNGVRRFQEDARRRRAELQLLDGVYLSLEMAHSEFFHQPGKPAETRPAPILEDLRRRDFSINAVGVSLTSGSRGLLLDPTNGLADIANRELRVLHPYSFLHDPVRLLRLVRFATRLNFHPDARTKELFEAALERGYQDYIQPEALGREAEQLTREENVVAVVKALAARELLPVLQSMLQRRKPDYEGLARFQKYQQQALEAGYQPDPYYAVLYYLRRRLKGRAEKQLLRNLDLSQAQRKQALALPGEAKKVLKLLGRRRKAGPRQIYHLLTPVPVELLLFLLAEYTGKKKIRAKVYNYLFKYRPLRQKLPVRELQLMGVSPGPKFDRILEQYFEALLDGKLRARQRQLKFLRKLAGIPKPEPKPEPKPKKVKKAAKLPVAPPAPAPQEAPREAPAPARAPRPEAKPSAEKAPPQKAPAKAAKRAAKKAPKKPAKKPRPKRREKKKRKKKRVKK